MIDYVKTMNVFSTTLLEGEVVTLIASGELIAIRDGVYDAELHVRPADPVITPVLTSAQLAVEEYPFEREGLPMYVQELFIPANESPEGNTVDVLRGIMQYEVFVPISQADGYDLASLHTISRYIRELFDPELPLLQTTEHFNVSVVIDEATSAPILKDDGWASVPNSLFFRTINIS